MKQRVAPLQPRSALGERAHKVTWLELFFDLVFVAAIAQVAEPLRHHYSLVELGRLAPLLLLIWWAWTGHTIYSTRFETDATLQRLITFLQMFVVAAMAANATEALDSRSTAGFVAAYAALRVLLVAQYARARRIADVHPLVNRYIAGHGVAAAIWLASAVVPPPARFWLWGVAAVVDLATPWASVSHDLKVPPQPSHLPERFGLFTLILLGDAVIAVMKGMESQDDWAPQAAASAVLGMGIVCAIWWWYFGGAGGGLEQHVRTRRDVVRFQLWSYAHFPFSLAVILVGAGLQRIVTTATRSTLGPSDVLLLTAAMTLVMLSLTAIAAASGRVPRVTLLRHGALAAATAAVGSIALPTVPVVLVIALAVLLFAQLAVSASSPLARRAAHAEAPQPAGEPVERPFAQQSL